jgi:hypothetical protein
MEEQEVQLNGIVVSEHMLNSLRSTKPWTLFVSILGFAATAMIFLAGLLVLVAGLLLPDQKGPMMIGAGIAYICLTVLYLIPSLYLYKYSGAVGRFLNLKQAVEMEAALAWQKSFWKFVGVLCIIMVALTILAIIAVIAIGFMTAKFL